jgi:4-hydroxy-3-polyprenylbenzoate decarboxylase
MLKPMAPDLIDYNMPENGVFHNLIMAKMKTLYKGHAIQFMHAFWGVGQMSFVKHALFVGENAPELEESEALVEHILNRLSPERVFITKGIVDHLDHSSSEQFVGGKLGVDATEDEVEEGVKELLSDEVLLEKIQNIQSRVKALKQYMTHTKNPICVIAVDKKKSQQKLMKKLEVLKKHIKVLIIVDVANNDIEDPYMLIWRVVNNMDAGRDVILKPFIAIDATNKSEVDGFNREWPGDTFCTKSVLDDLQAKGLIDIDEAFVRKFGLLPFE